MSRTIVVWIVLLGVAAIGGVWFFANYERVTERQWVGYSGEARLNQYLAAERLLARMGVAARHVKTIPELKGCRYKIARLLGMGRIARALSDEQGQYESQRFATTLDDTDRVWRNWLGDSATRLILNDRVVVRMISETAWRAKLRPRTVAIGLVRDYRLE